MANTRASRTKTSVSRQTRDYYYTDGNTVRKVQEVPDRYSTPARTKTKKVSRNAHKNRAKALQTSRGYVMFLAVASVATLFMCVHFLQLKATVTNQTKTISSLESQLNTLQSENDALYDQALMSVNMDSIKEYAMTQLGMHYASKDQIKWYSITGESYFRQYASVPEAK